MPLNLKEAYQLAAQRFAEGKLSEAESICRQILQVVPADTVTWRSLAVILSQKGQFEESFGLFHRLLAVQPNDPGVLDDFGTALALSDRWDQAVAVFQQVLKLRPDSPQTLWNLNALVLRKMMARTALLPGPYLGDVVVLLHCDRAVREELRRAGFHGGFQVDPATGSDPSLDVLLAARDDPPRRIERLTRWLDWLRNEAAMTGATATVWANLLPDEFAQFIRQAGGADLIEVAASSAEDILSQLAPRVVPLPPTDGKIFAVVSIRNGRLDLLPHWLDHYTRLGVDEILLGVFEDVNESITQELVRLRQRWSFRTFPQRYSAAVEAEHYSQRQTGCRKAGALPGTWILHADLDELHEYPAPLRQIADEAARQGISVVSGFLYDRVAADGSLPPILQAPSLWEQFPIECKLTERLLHGQLEKIMLARFSVQVNVGHHTPFNATPGFPIGAQANYRVAHFKWHSELVPRLRWSLERPNAHQVWKRESLLFLDWLDKHGGRLDLADPALECRPALFSRAHHLHLAGRFAEAEPLYRQAIDSQPDFAPAHSNLGIILYAKGDLQGATAGFRRAVELSPDLAEAHFNLGRVLQSLEDLPGAIASLRAAVNLSPNYYQAWNSLGQVLSESGESAQAIAALRSAVELNPDLAQAHMELGLNLLRSGDFQNGWREYEWRWRIPDLFVSPLKFPIPPWEGEDLKDKRLLLHAEQGWGDAIQFIRYAPLLAERGAKVIFFGPPQLFRVLQTAPGVDEWIDWSQSPTFQAHCPLLNLPRVFKTDLTNIPAKTPYLSAEPALTRQWNQRLPPGRGLNVGLCWAGRPEHLRDRQRSIPLARLAELWDVSNVRFISLQKGPAADQIRSASLELSDWSNELTDLADTAALIVNLDLVLTVDTSVAHLAGALGKPVWLLLSSVPDWRWMLDRADSPWYPTMRLFRQKSRGDWSAPIAEVLTALRSL
jgi:tetratricopeptide (TPR) repeat protein